MSVKIVTTFLSLFLLATACQTVPAEPDVASPPSGVVETLRQDEVLQQEIIVNADQSEVWDAFTTSDGYMAWASPFAHIEFGVEGFIESSYELDGELGRDGNIRLRIVAFIPERLLVLKTDKAPPGFASEETLEKLVSVFESLPTDDGRTRILVTGVGYGDDEESEKLKSFFIGGNSWSLQALHKRFESGPTDWPVVFAARQAQ